MKVERLTDTDVQNWTVEGIQEAAEKDSFLLCNGEAKVQDGVVFCELYAQKEEAGNFSLYCEMIKETGEDMLALGRYEVPHLFTAEGLLNMELTHIMRESVIESQSVMGKGYTIDLRMSNVDEHAIQEAEERAAKLDNAVGLTKTARFEDNSYMKMMLVIQSDGSRKCYGDLFDENDHCVDTMPVKPFFVGKWSAYNMDNGTAYIAEVNGIDKELEKEWEPDAEASSLPSEESKEEENFQDFEPAPSKPVKKKTARTMDMEY